MLIIPANTWMFFCAASSFVASNAARSFFFAAAVFACLVDTIVHPRQFSSKPENKHVSCRYKRQTYPIHFTQIPCNYKLNGLKFTIQARFFSDKCLKQAHFSPFCRVSTFGVAFFTEKESPIRRTMYGMPNSVNVHIAVLLFEKRALPSMEPCPFIHRLLVITRSIHKLYHTGYLCICRQHEYGRFMNG